MTYGLIIYGPKFDWGIGKHVKGIMRATRQALRWHVQAKRVAPAPRMKFISDNEYQLNLKWRIDQAVDKIIFDYEAFSREERPSKAIAQAVMDELGLERYQSRHHHDLGCNEPETNCPGNVELVHWRTREIPDESTRIQPMSDEEAKAWMANWRANRIEENQ